MTITQWNSSRYPVWASLARDYLPIMASSVSSERAFSSAGVTISKRRNRLKPDIVEALQFLKCLHRRELICREEPSMISESQMETPAQEPVEALEGTEVSGERENWDDIVGDLEDNEDFEDFDDEEVFVQGIV
jgi:hAT family C-terminal dimerisation region